MTLHVYTNLIQLPVLVLNPFLDSAPAVDPRMLTVTLDGGKPFHPVHVRPQGEDPISLAILFDVSQSDFDMLPGFANVAAKFATKSLRPHDEVAIYTLNCTLTRTGDFAPPDPASLRKVTDVAIESVKLGRKHHRPCGSSLQLRTSLAMTIQELSRRPGRRVILAISGGTDVGSLLTVEDVHQAASDNGVSIFGLTPVFAFQSPVGVGGRRSSLGGPSGASGSLSALSTLSPSGSFGALCEETGGIALRTSDDSLPNDLRTFVKMLRERIIIEFPRPREATPGTHILSVQIAKSHAFIRPAGIQIPVADPRVAADPSTISMGDSQPQVDPAPAPTHPVIPKE